MKKLLIGVVTSNIDKENVSEVIQGIIAQSHKCKCDIAVLSPLNNLQTIWNKHRKTSLDIYKLIASPRFDGFIFDKRYIDNPEVEKFCESLLEKTNKTVVMVDGGKHKYFENASSDDRKPFEELTNHLIEEHGYKKIYCLTGPKDNPDAQERLKGYKDAMEAHNLYFDQSYWRYGDFWKKSAKKLADEIISKTISTPEAIICGNDIVAEELIMRLISSGIRVPEDIAVVGFDCGNDNQECNIGITSYKRANFQLGAETMRRLYRLLTGINPSRVNNRIEGLRINSSCGCHPYRYKNKKEERMRKLRCDFGGKLYTREIVYEAELEHDLKGALKVISRYIFFLYHYSKFSIFLTEATMKTLQTGETNELTFDLNSKMYHSAEFNSNFKNRFTDKIFFMKDIFPEYTETTNKPSAYFLSPLNYGDQYFGYTALSYGKYPYTYDISYQMFIKYIDNIFFRLIEKTTQTNKNITAESCISGQKKLLYYIKEKTSEQDDDMIFISCEITDIKLLYGKYGGKNVISIIRKLAADLAERINDDEVCSFFSENRFCIITKFPNRIDEIFRELKNSIIFLNEPISIALGTCRFQPKTIKETDDIFDLLGEAMNHTVHTYKNHNYGSRRLYEKLYDLRKELENTPEKDWTIDMMCNRVHISRSTLQKNYKAFFGKSIIDELIVFRIAKAKQLLKNSNYPLTKIAELCGYSSDTYLIKQFKKIENITPNEYREQNT